MSTEAGEQEGLSSSSRDLGEAASAPLARRLVPALYGVADALVPPGPGTRGGGDVDVAPGVARRLRHRGPGAARRAFAVLAYLEWAPRLRGGSPFSRRPREVRAAALARLRASRLAPLRRGLAMLEGLLGEVLEAEGVARARPTAAARSPHSSVGA